MATSDIMKKLEEELNSGIKTEPQVVYLLTQIRKIIERDNLKEQYARLKFHCDWVLHSSMDRAEAKAILKEFDAAYGHLSGTVKLIDLPEPLKSEIDRISKLRSFEEELSKFLAAYGLPLLTRHSFDGWTHFLYLYGKVIEDTPLEVSRIAAKYKPKQVTPGSGLKYISHVIVKCESARETVKCADVEEVLFKLTWTSYNESGKFGDIFVINSFQKRRKLP